MTKIAILDAFTTDSGRNKLAGNPAAVVLSTEPLDEQARRNIAIELNQPAIAFVSHPALETPSSFVSAVSAPLPLIRWHTFTGASLPLCGHATMAASSYLLDYFAPSLPQIRYEFFLPSIDAQGTKTETSHELVAERTDDGRIEIALPASMAPQQVPDEHKESIFRALKAASGIAQSDVVELSSSPSNNSWEHNLTVTLSPEVDLGALKVDSPAFLTIPYRGIYLTNRYPTPSPYHFRSRTFFPSVGILEDQVCGSAHTRLGPMWIEQLEAAGTPLPPVVEVDQVSPRGGQFALRWDGKWGEDGGLVSLRGKAKLIMEGELRI
ncbi:hypothetical protein JCM10212_002001 [Sporobolomyces blumeae]